MAEILGSVSFAQLSVYGLGWAGRSEARVLDAGGITSRAERFISRGWGCLRLPLRATAAGSTLDASSWIRMVLSISARTSASWKAVSRHELSILVFNFDGMLGTAINLILDDDPVETIFPVLRRMSGHR